MEPLRIGILMTRPKAEAKKDEVVRCPLTKNTERPWLCKHGFKEFLTREQIRTVNKFIVKYKYRESVPADASIGIYIMYAWKNVVVDFILPEEITPERLKSNHLNFMLIYDLLESFHVDGYKRFETVRKALETADNIYPPYSYQKFINNKCNYIKHVSKQSPKNVIDTYCLNVEVYRDVGLTVCVDRIIDQADKRKWGTSFVAKPVFGQESIDFKILKSRSDLESYIKMAFVTKKYPGIIFQEYIKDFDKNRPEIRMYYIGHDYAYSVITTHTSVSLPKCEGGGREVKTMKQLKSFASKVFRNLPPIKVQGVVLDKLLTRLDIACNHKFETPFLVNEIEFVPSLYISDINKVPESLLGDRMVKVCIDLIKGSKRYEYV